MRGCLLAIVFHVETTGKFLNVYNNDKMNQIVKVKIRKELLLFKSVLNTKKY